MRWPSVSVVIPSFNQGRFIERTLRSVLGQGYPGPLEVIVADGGSADETVGVLRRYPQVRWWSEPDAGFVDAVTRGLAAATGEVVAIQSSDDFYLRGALARAAAALRDDPGIDFVTGNEIRQEDGRLLYPPPLPWTTLTSPGALIARTPVFNLPQHCTFARRSAVDRVGGLRAAVDRCADFDLWYRLLHFGRALVLPDYLGVCQIHAGQRTQGRADLWIGALERVVEDAERDPVYAARFVPPPQMKRDIFLQWEVLWNIAAGGEEGVRAGRALARRALEQPEDWPGYVLDFIKAYGSEPPEAAPPDPAESFVGEPQNEASAPPHPPRPDLLRDVRQSRLLRGVFGKAPVAHPGALPGHDAAGAVPVLTRQDAPAEVTSVRAAPEAVDADWWAEPIRKRYTNGKRSLSDEGRQMLEAKTEKRKDEWNRYVQERVAGPLRPSGFLVPEKTRSALIIVPGSSGDVVLATTLVRYIKDRNPGCRVSFAVKRSNLPFVRMCPGVDEVIEYPPETVANPRGRRRSLTKYADNADAVVYPICDPEDMDLLLRYNFLETIWLLAGVPDGVPEEPQPLWIVPPHDPDTAERVLSRSFSRGFASQLIAEAGRQPGKLIKKSLRERKVKNAGWKHIPKSVLRLLHNSAHVRRLPARPALSEAGRRLVIVSSDANMFPEPAKGLFEEIIRFLRSRGRIVLQNVLDPAQAAPGTIPLVCSYHEFLCLREAGIPFVGWRSGLCDIAAVSSAPMCTVYPSSFKGCGNLIQATMEKPIESFGFASMNIATDCLEIVCDSAADLDLEKLATILE